MISDNSLAMCELKNDLLYRRIPEGRHRYYVEKSLHAGKQAAEKLKRKSGETDFKKICQQSGIEIIYEDRGSTHYGISFRAQSEYSLDGSSKIYIYRDSIRLLAQKSQEELSGLLEKYPVDYETALQMHLAHEYFHYLEFCSSEKKEEAVTDIYSLGYVSEALEPVSLPSLFRRRRTGNIQKCSEIAAHAFAEKMLDLAVLPNYYDYIYLICQKKMKAEVFFEILTDNSSCFVD